MARSGLNCTLSYTRGSTKRTYQVRVDRFTHGNQMIAEEANGRNRRAYYPHRTAPQRFAIQVICVGTGEKSDFINWLGSYASYAIDPDNSSDDFPSMQVSIPSREFLTRGVPLQGYQWGTHVGQMVWNIQVVFEAAVEPGEKGRPQTAFIANKSAVYGKDDAFKYFFPWGTQLTGDAAPAGNYDTPQYPGDPSQFNDAWNNTPAKPSGPLLPVAPGQNPNVPGTSGWTVP